MSARKAATGAARAAMDPLEVALAGTQLVEASAGTGKTHAITTLFVRLLLEGGVTADQILVVTYTNAATAELRDRIRRRVATAFAACGSPDALPDPESDLRDLLARRRAHAREDRSALEAALRSFDETAISTVHSFCQRVLRENAFECGASFDVRLLGDESRLRNEILRDFWVQELSGAGRELVAAASRDPRLDLRPLAGLVRKALSNPDLRLLPEPPAAPGTADLRAWRSAYRAVVDSWDRAALEDLLCNDRGLRHAADSYRNDQVAVLLDGFEAAIGIETPGVSLRFERLEMLTPAGLAARTKKNGVAPPHSFFDACARLAEAEAPWQRQLLGLACRLVGRAREEASKRKQHLDCLSFDDLLLRLREGLRQGGDGALAAAIRRRHPVALIDEFQDTDPVQWEIFDLVWRRAGGPLFLIGDPKQAIYGFRGADVFAYLEAKRQAAAVWDLDVNRRSDPGLLRALNAFFGSADSPFGLEDIPYVDVTAAPGRTDALRDAPRSGEVPPELTAPFRILLLSDEHRGGRDVINVGTARQIIPPRIAGEIVRLLEARVTIPRRGPGAGGRVRPGDVAVLCRTNQEAHEVQEALLARNVPAVLQGDRSVFESEEARDIAVLLEAIAEPTDPRRLRAAMATGLYGATADDIASFEEDDRLFDQATARFFAWHGEWAEHGFLRAFRAMLDALGMPARLLRGPRGERRLTNVLHVAELLHRAAVTGHRGPHELIDWLRREIEEGTTLGELAPEEVQIRLESDAAAVTLTTIHKAKGLEWPVVFCPYLWQESKLRFDDEIHLRFHDAEGRQCLDVGSPQFEAHRKLAEEECRAESLRLLYVALTRARHQCSIVWGGIRGAEGSPLARFLAPGQTLADEAAIRAAMAPLVTRAGEALAVTTLDAPKDHPWRDDDAAPALLAAPGFNRPRLDDSWRTSSFTALAAASSAEVSREARDGADRDELTTSEPLTGAGASMTAADLPLADFPAGARAGILVHEILERVDFARADPALFERTIEARLRLGGFEARWREPLRTSIEALLDTAIETPRGGVRLSEVPAQKRLPEMGFTLPVGPDDGRRVLTRGALARVFARHASSAVPRDYAARVRALGFAALAGSLRGSIDLVFEHDDRFWLIDWKSNHLGRQAADYRPERLGGAMSAHHYVLQYHLYVAALDRYLRLRKPGYVYERDFGGVLYLFVRGFRPGGDGTTGVFFDRPSGALVESLTSLLESAEAEADR